MACASEPRPVADRTPSVLVPPLLANRTAGAPKPHPVANRADGAPSYIPTCIPMPSLEPLCMPISLFMPPCKAPDKAFIQAFTQAFTCSDPGSGYLPCSGPQLQMPCLLQGQFLFLGLSSCLGSCLSQKPEWLFQLLCLSLWTWDLQVRHKHIVSHILQKNRRENVLLTNLVDRWWNHYRTKSNYIYLVLILFFELWHDCLKLMTRILNQISMLTGGFSAAV